MAYVGERSIDIYILQFLQLREQDRHVTGIAHPEACHIEPFTAPGDTQTKPIAVDQHRVMRLLSWWISDADQCASMSPKRTRGNLTTTNNTLDCSNTRPTLMDKIPSFVAKQLACSDRPWSMLALNQHFYYCWGKANCFFPIYERIPEIQHLDSCNQRLRLATMKTRLQSWVKRL